MLVNLVVNGLGLFTLLFIFWKRLKEDYESEIIFKTSTNIVLGLLVGFLLSNKFFPDWFLYAEFLGINVGVGLSVTNFKMRFYETFEAAVISFLPWLSLVFLGDSITASSLSSFLGFLVILIIIFFYYYMDTHYRDFTWYPSGKVGFAGLASLTLVFVVRSLLAIFGISVLSFVGNYEAIMSGVLAFISLLLLFRLGRKSY